MNIICCGICAYFVVLLFSYISVFFSNSPPVCKLAHMSIIGDLYNTIKLIDTCKFEAGGELLNRHRGILSANNASRIIDGRTDARWLTLIQDRRLSLLHPSAALIVVSQFWAGDEQTLRVTERPQTSYFFRSVICSYICVLYRHQIIVGLLILTEDRVWTTCLPLLHSSIQPGSESATSQSQVQLHFVALPCYKRYYLAKTAK